MKILFMGTPDFAATSLKALYDNNYDVVGVFTQPDKPVGRKQKLEKSPVKCLAEEHGTPVFQPTKLRDGTAMETVRALNPDLIAVVAYGRILPDDILEFPKYGSINIHGSLLPKYRGSAPIQWSVINGDEFAGVTAMYMAHDLDAGDIIEERSTKILEGETSGELFIRLADIGAELLCKTIDDIEMGTATRTPQNEALVSFAPQLTKEMAEINWELSPEKIISHINGMNPWPIATTTIQGQKFKVFKAEIFPYGAKAACGTIISADKNGIVIVCSGGAIAIKELQAPGGKRMQAVDYLRGHPICL